MLIHSDDQAATTQAAAEIMAKLRPDLYTVERARRNLEDWIDSAKHRELGYMIGSGGFMLIRVQDGDNCQGYELVQHLVDWNWFEGADGAQDFSGAIWKSEWATTPIVEVVGV